MGVQFCIVKTRVDMHNGEAKWKSEKIALLLVCESCGFPLPKLMLLSHVKSIDHLWCFSSKCLYCDLIWTIYHSRHFSELIWLFIFILSWASLVMHVFSSRKMAPSYLARRSVCIVPAVVFPNWFLGACNWAKYPRPPQFLFWETVVCLLSK